MRRPRTSWKVIAALAGALCLAAGELPALGQSPAQPEPPTPTPTLRRVTLTQAGVGTFDYRATVDGAATLHLDLPRADVADALRSLVVRDGAGTVTAIELPGDAPAAAAFAHLPVPAAALASPIDLLRALRGQPVTVAGARPISGVLVSAQGWPPPAAGPHADRPRSRVTLLTDSGLQSFAFDDVASVHVDDPALRLQLDAALAASRGIAVAADRRRLAIRLQGQGTRPVDLSMVLPVPLWKATYRLLLPAPDATRARLQAWAVVENAGLEDWQAIQLVLHAGNPVAFRQDVYAMVRVTRPTVAADLLAHPAPGADTGAMPAGAAADKLRPLARFAAAPPQMASAMAAPAPPAAPVARPTGQAAVEGEALAASFVLPAPVSLEAGHTASLPFLDLDLPARRVWMLAAFAPHPLAGIELTNDGPANLPPGAVTTLGADGFVGDALLGVFPAGARRVLSYAEDPAIGAAWDTGQTSRLVGVAAARGVLRITRRERQATTISLSSTGAGGHVLVDIPLDPGTTLSTEPAGLPVQRLPAAWRIDVPLAPAGATRLVANADRTTEQSLAVLDDPGSVAALVGDPDLAPQARAALSRVADLRAAADARATALETLRQQRQGLSDDEQRVRANLGAVGPNDPLRGRFLDALARAEDAIAALDGHIGQARQAAEAAQAALADAIAGLSF